MLINLRTLQRQLRQTVCRETGKKGVKWQWKAGGNEQVSGLGSFWKKELEYEVREKGLTDKQKARCALAALSRHSPIPANTAIYDPSNDGVRQDREHPQWTSQPYLPTLFTFFLSGKLNCLKKLTLWYKKNKKHVCIFII